MSFGFGSGGGGFGQNNQASSFGSSAFGGNNNTGGGFGSTGTPAFGSGNTGTTGGSLFGGNTTSSFGSGGGGAFGTNTNNNQQAGSVFGQQQNRPGGFGTTNTTTPAAGGMFGGANNASTGNTTFGSGGGFGSGTTAGAFGTNTNTNTGGGLFGKTAAPSGFGTSNTTGGFGSGGGGFGATNTTTPSTGFGSTGTAFQGALAPCEGTGSTPFTPFTEKDANTSATNHYHSISFMQPYSKFSFEELRLADYQQGRRFGNGSGQGAGAFGSTAFGSSTGGGFGTQQNTGFGTSTTTPFGGAAATSAPGAFGQTQTTGAFGSSNSNPLFGGAKPATPMFGSTPTTGAAQPSGFGAGNTTGGAFGNTGSTGAFGNTGNSLFGQNTQQNKPAFGAPAATNTAGAFGGFGSQQTTAPANAFGSTTATAPAFGQQQTGTNTLGGFGAQNQTQNKPGGLFGSGTGGGFGSSTTQPNTGGGLFGGGNTSGTGTSGGGLFGQQQNQQQQQQPAAGGGLFGGGQSTNTGGGLFGSSQTQQPAKPAGGLFGGGSSTGTGSTFGGFGASQPQQNTGGGLFGNTQNQQQQKPGGMFGSTSGTGGLFNQSSTGQNTGGSLFGSQNQQQQPANNSMFGGSQPAQQQPQQPVPGSLTSSLLDGNPYGSQSIFSGLPGPNAPSPGPLATPLSASQKQKRRTPLPVYNMTPGAANRLITPPKRNQGYGFSYSTYGSPSSASSTPGFSNSLLGSGPSSGSLRGSVGGSFGRSFSKSYSTSNLRNSFNPDSDSVLSPGALQVGSGRGGSDKLKRLQIDRSLRNDLFTRPSSSSPAPITNGEDASQSSDKLKKKVSFDSTSPGVSGGELVRVESKSPEPTPQELGFLRSTRKSGSLNGIDTVDRPEMESLNLAVVPENGEPVTRATTTSKRLVTVPGSDPKPGEYWMKPSFAELSKLSRDQLRRVVDFTVGRQNCGEVTFNGPVDLNGTDLSDLFGTIVDIGLRKITVYPDEATKPPMGKGLNVPSTLRIENSWPRGRDKKKPAPITSGPLFDKHIDRLQKVTDTEFVDYEVDTGTWVFIVPHFTTYGLDYDEDEEGESLDQSTMSAGPDNHTPKPQRDHPVSFEQSATFSIDESFVGSMAGMDDDTFDFKKHKLVPGSFGNQAMAIEDHDMVSEGETESFLEEGSAGSIIEHDDDVTVSQHSGDSMFGSDEREEMDMAGSFPNIHRTVEHDDDQSSILDTTQPMFKHFGTPPKPSLNLSGDWTEQLQRTISPRKQNRDALREIQANAFTDRHLLNDDSPSEKMASPKKGFTNSIDLMNSLFQQQPKKQNTASQMNASKSQPKGFEWPYPKQPKTFADDTTPMDQKDLAFHESFKPRWGPMDSIVCAKGDFTAPIEGTGNRWNERFSIFSEGRDVAVMDYSQPTESKEMLDIQRQQSTIQRVDGTPLVRMAKIDLRQFALSHGTEEERLIWQLTNILFNDDIEDDISAGVPPQLRSQFAHRIKKDRLTRLWKGIIRDRHAHDLDRIRSPEERAVHLLCSHRVEEACKTLVDSQNIHLATLVAQIGRDATSRTDMAKQIEVWRQNNVLSEMTEPVRALYELVAGNGLRSEGKSGGALEDRASSFGFTDRFELDWLQAFGLRLWYSTTEDEPIETAVAKFLDDLATGLEPAFPHPAHRAGTRAAVQPGSDTVGRESPLWVLLKIYSGVNGNAKIPSIELPAALLPESLSGDVLSNRLSFQFHHVLATVVGQSNAVKINQVQTDRLVWDYASELIASGELAPALFVLLHLSQPDDRKRAVQETLARFGPHLPDPTLQGDAGPDAAWQHLTTDLQLPDAWIWVAKALDARDRGDAIREVDCLIRGRHWNDAHATFCRVVGPTTIISRDYHTLDQLVTGFGEGPERKMRGWSSGGGVYEDFLRLATAPRGRRDPTRLSRLVNALVAMGDRVRTGSGIDGLEERVAFKEMSRTLAGWMTHEDVQSIDSSSALRLPLTGDARMQQTLEISRRYYGTIMAGGF
ncbi:hypothetical protein N7456_009416 [Penicillium angulare]|uniref:Peptidase S59 domain-containing protein n=1 Tax=Penicillium angulare TaxID=116970 RepID=A0A9W9K5I9_9EURO|nr:hypothetical protein N7456_009416 [Penicillium angulare]